MNKELCNSETKKKCDSFYKEAFLNRKDYIQMLEKENTQLKENWDKLEEYCKNYAYWVKDNVDMFKVWKTFHLVLDKMKELKESEDK